jgi:hypothetical protein
MAELGIHWDNTRQAWQHPCGMITDEMTDYDPRKRYGNYFAADRMQPDYQSSSVTLTTQSGYGTCDPFIARQRI